MKKAAELLVKCGYAERFNYVKGRSPEYVLQGDMFDNGYEWIEPYTDTLEGRRQADALEDWLNRQHSKLWLNSGFRIIDGKDEWDTAYLWRLDRIKWCMKQLEAE